MKISAINTYSYYKNHRLQNTSQYLMSAPATCLHSDSVSFTGKTKNKSSYFVYDMRELEGLTCACCGIKMLKASDANKFLNNKVYYPVYEGLNKMVENGLINPNRENEPMQKAFSFMYKFSRENQQMTLNEFYTNDYVKHQRKKLTAAENKALDELREKIKLVAHSSGYLITELTKLNPPFQELEQKVYKELYTLAKMRPDEDFNTILNKPEIKKIYLNSLKAKQMRTLDRITPVIKDLPLKYKKPLEEAIEESKYIFTDEKENTIHKRKRVIETFSTITNRMQDKQKAAEIQEILNTLPDSKNDVDAFMVRVAKKDPNAIMEILISRIRSTNEHVIPHHREDNNGPSNKTNYICLCGKCNSERQRTSYEIFVEHHPEMIANTQRQMDKIIYFINKGILLNHNDYPEAIKQRLNIESGGTTKTRGKIYLDTSALDINQAKVNRKLREEKFSTGKTQRKLIEEFGELYKHSNRKKSKHS